MSQAGARIEATLTRGYQVTMPSAVRKILGLEPGEKVLFEVSGENVTLVKAATREEQLKAVLEKMDQISAKYEKTKTPEQRELMRRTQGWTAGQYREYMDQLPENRAKIKEKYNV